MNRCAQLQSAIKPRWGVAYLPCCLLLSVCLELGASDQPGPQVHVDPTYPFYTVPAGVMTWGCLRLLDVPSVKEFQTAMRLKSDGIVGPETWTAISKELAKRGARAPGTGECPLNITLVPDGQNLKVVISNRLERGLLLSGINEGRNGGWTNQALRLWIGGKVDGRRGSRTYTGTASSAFIDFASPVSITGRAAVTQEVQLVRSPDLGSTTLVVDAVITCSKDVYHVHSSAFVPFVVHKEKSGQNGP